MASLKNTKWRKPLDGSLESQPCLDIFTKEELQEIENLANDPCLRKDKPEVWLMLLNRLVGDDSSISFKDLYVKLNSKGKGTRLKVRLGKFKLEDKKSEKKERESLWLYVFQGFCAFLSSGLVSAIIECLKNK